jgi:hypothetical protein
MKIIVKEPTFEHRSYKSWVDVKRARSQLRKRGARTVKYLDVKGPAIQIIWHPSETVSVLS